MRLAAVSALLVASFSDLLSCSASSSVVIRAPRFVLELLDQLGRRSDLDAGLAAGGSTVFTTFEPRRDVDAVVAGVLSSIGFFFAFMMFGSEA
jgi:hypothetical protein